MLAAILILAYYFTKVFSKFFIVQFLLHKKMASSIGGSPKHPVMTVQEEAVQSKSSTHLQLNDGYFIPVIGFGTWVSDPQFTGRAIDVAVRAGYRHIDGAMMYENEKEIGEALQTLYKEGVVKREDLFITSKLLMTYMNSKEDVFECCDIILKNLQTDYLDLFLINHPIALGKGVDYLNLKRADGEYRYDEDTIAAVWQAMEELVSKGKVKSIGVSNFTITKTDKLLKTAKIVPAVNEGIAMRVYAPLGCPGNYWMMNDHRQQPLCNVLLDPLINKIARVHHATPAQVCISFLLHLGLIVLPKSAKESRIIENLQASRLVLSQDEITNLKKLDKNLRCFRLNEYYFTSEEEFWDIEQDNSLFDGIHLNH